jgi:hypothetical protein
MFCSKLKRKWQSNSMLDSSKLWSVSLGIKHGCSRQEKCQDLDLCWLSLSHFNGYYDGEKKKTQWKIKGVT